MEPARIVEYVDGDGQSPFGRWFAEIDATVAAKVVVAIGRIERGLLGNVKPVGEGVSEIRIDFGPGYRVYCATDRPTLVILLGGGSKKRQQRDIETAKARWSDYKARKA